MGGLGLSRSTGFLGESLAELRKVSFPTRQETLQATLVTIFLVFVMSMSLLILDAVFNWLMGNLVG